MKKSLSFLFYLSLVVIQFTASAQKQQNNELEFDYIAVTKQEITDSSLLKLLKPYRDSVNKAMSKVIGFATATLYMKQPESPLSNFLADAMKMMVEEKFNRKIDAAVINAGGIRSYIPKGNITMLHAFELMPYDNNIVLQELKGSVLKKYLDHTASKGGWGLSGITMQIKDRSADSIYINGKAIDDNATYVVANTDYIANGGDNTPILKTIPHISIGYLYRDAIVDYILRFTKSGKPVTAALERRVVNVD